MVDPGIRFCVGNNAEWLSGDGATPVPGLEGETSDMSETTRGPAEPIRYSAIAFKQTSLGQKIQ